MELKIGIDLKKKWTEISIKIEALKYKSRFEFKKSSPAYHAASKLKILPDVCSHMYYRQIRWTKEMVYTEALKYNNRNAFEEGCSAAYQTARRLNILALVCSHMDVLWEKKWTKETIIQEALKYNTRASFYLGSSAYRAAQRLGMLDEVCSHMVRSSISSRPEIELFNFIKMKHITVIKLRDRKVKIPNFPLLRGFDIDIYSPELRKGIEFDGEYWHNKGFKRSWTSDPILYHKIKDEYFKAKGIELLHINEKDWNDNPDKCLEKCLEFLK